MKKREKYTNKICPDCGNEVKRLIEHHIITRRLAKYLIEIHGWEIPKVAQLRHDLKIAICQKCEKKFHNGEFYTHNPYPFEKKKNIELYGDKE